MRRIVATLFLFFLSSAAFAQNVGVSFSFFFPKGGEFSIPVSPFSYRGLALPLTNNFGVQTGASIYRIGGLNITGLPFESKKPLLGSGLTLYVPGEFYVQVGNNQATLTLKGGIFGFVSVFEKLNEGNFDRAIRKFEGWEVANSNLSFDSSPGFGLQTGVEFLFYVTRSFGLTFELNYLSGSANYAISGDYTGGNSGTLETVLADYQDAKVNFTGWEISLGAVFGQ